jgi:hypothetical protein
MVIGGNYFSFTSGSSGSGTDLIQRAETLTGMSDIVAKKLTLITSGSLAFRINNVPADSTLFRDTDGLYKLSLDAGDVYVSSLVVTQTSACPVFVAMVF